MSKDDAKAMLARMRSRAQGAALRTLARRYKAEYDQLYESNLRRLHRENGLPAPRMQKDGRR